MFFPVLYRLFGVGFVLLKSKGSAKKATLRASSHIPRHQDFVRDVKDLKASRDDAVRVCCQ